ncbi:MAG: hypothetical protein LBI57_06880 [Helicobacteraceae bacterium]|nr:hypothetical protein [Helicobacteraceae bacterium]
MITKGAPWRFNPNDIYMLTTLTARTNYVNDRYFSLYKRVGFRDSDRLKALLIGDSFSQDFYNMIAEAGILSGAEFRVNYIQAACQIYRGQDDPFAFINEADKTSCKRDVYNDQFIALQDKLIADADVAIFAASWLQWSAERLNKTIANFNIPQKAKVIVIGRKHFGAIAIKEYFSIPLDRRNVLRNDVGADHLETNAIMKKAFENQTRIKFVDLHAIVCGEESRSCPIFTPEGLLISFDGAHLTEAGAKYIGSLLKDHPTFVLSK